MRRSGAMIRKVFVEVDPHRHPLSLLPRFSLSLHFGIRCTPGSGYISGILAVHVVTSPTEEERIFPTIMSCNLFLCPDIPRWNVRFRASIAMEVE